MELPDELLMIIKEYAKPLTRPNWRQGSYIINRRLKKQLKDIFLNSGRYNQTQISSITSDNFKSWDIVETNNTKIYTGNYNY